MFAIFPVRTITTAKRIQLVNRHSGLLHPGFWLLNRGGSAPLIFSSQNSEYFLRLIVQPMVVGQSWNRGQLFRHVDFEVISRLSSS